jgi:hypothetical protein
MILFFTILIGGLMIVGDTELGMDLCGDQGDIAIEDFIKI